VRNLAPLLLEPEPRFNVFYGDNGQGKTNLLETIYVVGALRSFRTQRMAEIITTGKDEAYIGARVEREGLERLYELVQAPRSRRVRLDGKAVRPIARYFGGFNVVLFASEDLQVPRSNPAARRRFLDRAVFNRQPGYLGDAQAYEKVVKNRNALLRDLSAGSRHASHARDLLAVFDQQLGELGAKLVCSRLRYLDEMRPRFRSAFEAITQSGLEVDLDYVAPAEVLEVGPAYQELSAIMVELITRARPRDLARTSSTIGPHRDDLMFRFAGHAAASFASQGQLRALILAWKTAEMDLLAQTQGEPPVLLLDDVSSELDSTRNEYLFEALRSRENQCFITTTHPRHVLLGSDRVDFEVKAGVVSRKSP
jgi:DNA replication and repair protein RecF